MFANDVIEKGLISKTAQNLHAAQNQKNKQPNIKKGRSKSIFFQRRYTSGQKAHEEMLNTANY